MLFGMIVIRVVKTFFEVRTILVQRLPVEPLRQSAFSRWNSDMDSGQSVPRKAREHMRQFQPVDRQIASNRTPRHINTNVVFNLIRRNQPISRAELARRSNLRPSTVSLIIEELIASQWVLEGEAAKSSRGRKPLLLSLNHRRCVVALDIHPSQITIGVTTPFRQDLCGDRHLSPRPHRH